MLMIKDNMPMANYITSKAEMAFLDWDSFFLENSTYILNRNLIVMFV